MASNIVSTTIDETFPVAGQDNDSQGFRDNFSIIKENFGYAKTEIEDLQNNTAKINANNAFANNTLSVVNFEKSTETAYDVTSSTITTNTDVSFNNGHHIVVKVGDDVTLKFTDWPTTDQYSEIRLHIFGDGISSRTVEFASEYATSAISTLHTDASSPKNNNFEIASAGSFVAGRRYTILSLGTTDWNGAAGTSGKIYNVGSVFTASNAGSGDGTAFGNSTPWNNKTITIGTTLSTSYLIRAFTYDSGENVYLEYLGTFAEVS